MAVAGEDAFCTCRPNDGRDRVVVGGYNDFVSDVHLGDSLPDPDDEGESGKETEGFAGEAQGAEARRNDY
jgi:hypothetical protein